MQGNDTSPGPQCPCKRVNLRFLKRNQVGPEWDFLIFLLCFVEPEPSFVGWSQSLPKGTALAYLQLWQHFTSVSRIRRYCIHIRWSSRSGFVFGIRDRIRIQVIKNVRPFFKTRLVVRLGSGCPFNPSSVRPMCASPPPPPSRKNPVKDLSQLAPIGIKLSYRTFLSNQ